MPVMTSNSPGNLPGNPLVAAADYADALIVARRAKTTLCMLLFLLLGSAVTLFFLLRYVPSLAAMTAAAPPVPPDKATAATRGLLQYFVGLLDFAGLILPLLLAVMVVVTLLVQLVARVVGTGRMTGAVVWAVLLALLLFPWQAVLNNPTVASDPVASSIGLKIPGVIYTWAEVSNPVLGAKFAEVNAPPPPGGTAIDAKITAALHWLRYAGFPLLAMVIVGIVHTKTEPGLRQSFGTDVSILPPDGGTVVDPDGILVTPGGSQL